jgi:tetratricopeptide (TPR) repeat protein
MTVLYTILIFILYSVGLIVASRLINWTIGQFINYFDERKRNKSPYFKIKRKLEDDLRQANFSGDWKKRQEINLKLLWLTTYLRVQSNVLSRLNQDNDETSLIANFSEENIKFPIKWKLNDFYCYPFSQEIVSSYRKILSENAYEGMFKPNNILPVPKEYIIKAIHFIFDYLNQKESIYPVPDKDNLVENLNSIYAFLDISFIDTGDDDLPTENLENYKVGKVYEDKQEKHNEVEDLKLIDWRSEAEWLARGVHYAEKEQYDFAFACYDQAKKINPDSKNLKTMLGITYLTIGERQFDKGEKQLALENMEKSAELKNAEAIKWLSEHK